ncbi:hypothetical protein [Roseivirga sp. E12]|uniref:hypothetical protein n=1 Tax=Roseivirga sp. E12 TaxID=2819237 RepID=UPI001ABCB046|nr:hypothetical protein [Roseivirga sp. E12]MBO3696972.1 hypothetical protein [Roseivirga sp. E12]
MSIKVYSAAKAVSLKKGLTKEQAWKSIISMFHVESRLNYDAISFIYGRYRLEEKVKSLGDNNIIYNGDVFKATTVHGTSIYVTIKEWNPYESFSYDEQMWSKGETELSVPNRTDFRFLEHPEGTTIELIRREKADSSKWRMKGILGFFDHLWVSANSGSWAAFRLAHILGGNAKLKNNESTEVAGYKITRNDSLRKNFS